MEMVWAWPEILFSILITTFLIFVIYLLSRMINEAQTAPVNWPVIGMLAGVIANRHRLLDYTTANLRKSGCTYVFKGPWFSGMNFIVTCDPANANHIFNTHFADYPKGDDFKEFFDPLGDGIFNVDDDLWRHQRRMAQAGLHNTKFPSLIAKWSKEKVVSTVLPLLDAMGSSDRVLDLHDMFMRLTFDITCHLVFGIDPCSLALDFPTVPIVAALEEIEEVILLRHIEPMFWWKLKRALGIGKEKGVVMAKEVARLFTAQCIAKKKGEQHHQDQNSSDLLSLYMDLDLDNHNNIESGLVDYFRSDEFLHDAMLTFLFAGRDTIGSALSWFFHVLMANPEVEKKILKELSQVRWLLCEEHSSWWKMFEPEQMDDLVYLHAALCEAMRLFPPVPLNHKSASKEDVLPSGHRVHPGTMIIYSIYSAGRMERVWGKDCLQFKPERWISDDGKLKREPSYKFLAFHCGPRMCLGKDMAFTQMKIIVASIIYNFHVEAIEGHIVEPKLSVTLQMKNGLMVNVRKREKITY